MAVDTIVTGSKLTAIANAIRAKLGVQSTYTLEQMASAVASIPTGGGGLDLLLEPGSTVQSPDLDIVAADWGSDDGTNRTIKQYAFYESEYSKGRSRLRSVEIPRWIEAVDQHAFNFTNLQHITFLGDDTDAPIRLKSYALRESDIQELDLGNRVLALTNDAHPFNYNTSMTYFKANVVPSNPALSSWYWPTYMFGGCTSLQSIEIHQVASAYVGSAPSIPNGFVQNCTGLQTIALDITAGMMPLTFTSYMGTTTGITLYVPDSLLSAYQANSVWADWVTAGNTIAALSTYNPS